MIYIAVIAANNWLFSANNAVSFSWLCHLQTATVNIRLRFVPLAIIWWIAREVSLLYQSSIQTGYSSSGTLLTYKVMYVPRRLLIWEFQFAMRNLMTVKTPEFPKTTRATALILMFPLTSKPETPIRSRLIFCSPVRACPWATPDIITAAKRSALPWIRLALR